RRTCRLHVIARSLAKARTVARTYSAIGRSKTPRELVTTTSLSTSSGNSSRSTPAEAMCTQRRSVAAGQASRSASERKSHTNSTSAPRRACESCSTVTYRTFACFSTACIPGGRWSAYSTTTVGHVGVDIAVLLLAGYLDVDADFTVERR